MRPIRVTITPGSILLVLAFPLMGLFPAVVLRSGLHKNFTDSVPIGLYREARNGEYAAFCLPLLVVTEATKAGLDLDHGTCVGEVVPILKPLLAATFDSPITLTPDGIFFPQLIPNTKPKASSRTGKPLTHYPFGTYTSGLWAISSYNPNSFDSRYFGPVAPSSVLYHLTPFWIF